MGDSVQRETGEKRSGREQFRADEGHPFGRFASAEARNLRVLAGRIDRAFRARSVSKLSGMS